MWFLLAWISPQNSFSHRHSRTVSFRVVYDIWCIDLPNARLSSCRCSRLFLTFSTAPFMPIVDGENDGARRCGAYLFHAQNRIWVELWYRFSRFSRLFAFVTLTKTAGICIIISVSVAKICVVKELTSRKRKLPVRVPVALVFVLLKIQFRTLKTTNTWCVVWLLVLQTYFFAL